MTVPWTVFRYPLPGIMLSMMTDALDWSLFPFGSDMDHSDYQMWDKMLDMYASLVFGLYMIQTWRNPWAKNAGLLLLGWRLIGTVIFALTAWRPVLFWFANFFDHFFIFIEFGRLVLGRMVRILSKTAFFLTLMLILGLKLVQEYLLHIAGLFPWEEEFGRFFTGPGMIPHYSNISIWVGFFLLAHGLILYYFLRSQALTPSRRNV